MTHQEHRSTVRRADPDPGAPYSTSYDIVCPKCNANLDGEFDGFGVTSIEDEPEGGDANGEK